MWGRNGKKQSDLGDDGEFTFLGKGGDFKGVVTFDGTVRIDGRLEGEIHTKGTLVVGEHAVIKGIITAATLISSGKIRGNITATEKVQLIKPGILIGSVRSPSFSMEEGVHFQGGCDMGDPIWIEQDQDDSRENVHDLAAHRGKLRVQDIQP